MEPTNATIVAYAIMTLLMFIGIVYLLAGNTGSGGYGAGHSDYRYTAHAHPVESGTRKAVGVIGLLLRLLLTVAALLIGRGLMAAGEMIISHSGRDEL